jgi:hypothetical protein
MKGSRRGFGRPGLDEFPKLPDRMTEEALFRAHGLRPPPHQAHGVSSEPEKRTLAPVIDESGLVHGEPITQGRTARKGSN